MRAERIPAEKPRKERQLLQMVRADIHAAFRRSAETVWNRVARSVRRKFQFPLNRLEARLFAQGVHERVGLQELEPRVT